MTELSLDERKSIALKILTEIHKICEENGFRYSLAYGTLLGAVRHKGFIPWDDDIDIFMPREDYLKFVKYCSENLIPFRLVSKENNKKYGYIFAKVCDNDTFLVCDDLKNSELGVFVDIFPVEALGDTYEEALSNYKKTKLCRELLVAWNWKKYFKSNTKKWYYEPVRFAFFLCSRLVTNSFLFNCILKEYPEDNFDGCKFAGTICGAYREKEIMTQNIYADIMDIEFEGLMFKAIASFDKYLKNIYGNYMELPPVEKRVTHHMYKAYRKLE